MIFCFGTISYKEIKMQIVQDFLFDHFYSYWNYSVRKLLLGKLFPDAWNKTLIKGSRPEAFLRNDVLKICTKFTGEHPCRSVISIKLLCNFNEIARRQGCFPVNLLYIFRTLFPKKTSERLLLLVLWSFIVTYSIIWHTLFSNSYVKRK